MKKTNLFLILCLLFSVTSSAKNLSLKFLDEVILDQNLTLDGMSVGGISGISFNKDQSKLYAISDDYEKIYKAKPRFYIFDFSWDGKKLSLLPKSTVLLNNEKDPLHSLHLFNPEGLATFSENELIIISEDLQKVGRESVPFISIINTKGEFLKDIPTPEKIRKHFVENKNFEGLSLSNSKKNLFVAMEGPLNTDDTVADFNKGSKNLILHYTLSKKGFEFYKEYYYNTDPIPKLGNVSTGVADNGISEILTLSENELLVLERAYVANAQSRSLRLYKVKFGSVKSGAVLKKELILKLEDVTADVDNLEAMAWGPKLKNGHRTILFAADNNFNPKHQRNQFLLFEVIP